MLLFGYFLLILFNLLFFDVEAVSRSLHTDLSTRKKSMPIGNRKFAKNLKYSENLEDLYNVYDPIFLSYLWPKLKNGVHMNLRNECWTDLGALMKDLQSGHAWAFNLVDASGRFESGLRLGNKYWIGSKESCQDLDYAFLAERYDVNKTAGDFRNDDYIDALQRQEFLYGSHDTWRQLMTQDDLMQRIIAANNVPPYRVKYSSASVQLNITKSALHANYDITLGVCMPDSCFFNDVKEILEFSIVLTNKLKANTKLSRNVKIVNIRPLTTDFLLADIKTPIILTVVIILVLLIIVATLIDYNVINVLSPRTRSFDIAQPTQRETETSTLGALSSTKVTTYVNTRSITPKMPDLKDTSNISFVMAKKFPYTNASLTKLNIQEEDSKNVDLVNVRSINRADSPIHLNEYAGCKKCGRYKKQCPNAKTQLDNIHKKIEVYEVVTNLPKPTTEFISFDRALFMKNILLSFSLKSTLKKIFNTELKEDNLSTLHGVKVLSLFWVILVHLCVFLIHLSDNIGHDIKQTFMFKIVESGTFAFDSLFFVSGLLNTHNYFELKSHYTAKDLVNFGGIFGEVLQFICFISNRAVRLLPPYIFVVLVSSSLSWRHYTSDTIYAGDMDYINCDKYWWRNLLYINTIFGKDEICLRGSWYLSEDTQFHLLGILLLSITNLRIVFLSILTCILVLVAWITNGIIVYKDYNKIGSNDIFSLYESIYVKPWSRLGPYAVGIFTGWCLFQLRNNVIHVPKVSRCLLWIVCVTILLSLPCKLYGVELGIYTSGIYNSLSHTAWCLALSWIVIASTFWYGGVLRNILSTPLFYPLSRITYCIYLSHTIVIRYLLISTGESIHYNGIIILIYYVGIMVLSILSGLLLSILIESPFSSLLKRIACNTDTRHNLT